ncbi:MAG: hypothetical protein ACREBR_05190 [bacterium]
MDKWKELNDFSMFEGNTPCPQCKGDSSKTLLGDHWKCAKCDHLFNKDGSATELQCFCKKCQKKDAKLRKAKNSKVQKALAKLKKVLDKQVGEAEKKEE